MTRDEVVDSIKRLLEQPSAIEILDEGIRTENDWWYVPVRRRVDIPKTYQYYDLLADLEERLDEEQHLQVLFVPAAE